MILRNFNHRPISILLDFDGTCVRHEFPKVGSDIGAQKVLKRLVAAGHGLILFTMRGDRTSTQEPNDKSIQNVQGPFLQDALDWFAKNEIPLYGVQKNPTQHNWTNSPKAYGQLIIDDTSIGIPLTSDGEHLFVNWHKLEELLELSNILQKSPTTDENYHTFTS